MPSIVYYYHTMCIYVFAMSYCIYCIIYYYDKTDDISNDLWVSETGVPGTPNTTPKSPHFFYHGGNEDIHWNWGFIYSFSGQSVWSLMISNDDPLCKTSVALSAHPSPLYPSPSCGTKNPWPLTVSDPQRSPSTTRSSPPWQSRRRTGRSEWIHGALRSTLAGAPKLINS